MEKIENNISLVEPRNTIEVHLPDGRVLNGPRNCELGTILRALHEFDNPPIVGAVVNGMLRELTYQVSMDLNVRPVTMSELDGMRIYRRSLIFLLDTAFDQLFPEAVLRVDHSIASGGYYCRVDGMPPLTNQDIIELEASMRKLVAADLLFNRKEVPLSHAISYFDFEGELDKVRLLSHRKKDYLTLYELDGHYDYHQGYMVPSTGFLNRFRLELIEDGFTLRFPRQNTPTELSPFVKYPKLLNTFRRYRNWLSLLGISSVGTLNDDIKNDRVHEVILVSEALHEQRVTDIASQIASQHDRIRVVIVAGPSASGKTTFSKRLSVQLLALGIAPFPLEMDKYFIDRDKTPRNEKGEIDFELITALNRERLSNDLNSLIAGGTVQLPCFDFLTGTSSPGETCPLKIKRDNHP